MPVLRLLSTDGRVIEREWEVPGNEVTIGRGHENAVVLSDSSVSRRHARLLVTPRGYLLTDEGSVNGIWVHNQRVGNGFLLSGDMFRVGDCLLQFFSDDARPGPTVVRVQPPPPLPEMPPEPAPARWGLWAALLLLFLGAGGCTVGLLLYVFRDAWQGLLHPAPAAALVAPELGEFGRYARVETETTLELDGRAARHALDDTAELVVPAAAIGAPVSLASAVVAIDYARASPEVKQAKAYVLSAPEGTILAQPLVIEIHRPAEKMSVAELVNGEVLPLLVPDGPMVRIGIDHFSRRTFTAVEWKDKRPAAAASPAVPATGAPKTLLDDPSYRRFTGAEPATYWSGRTEFCSVLTARVKNFPKVHFERPYGPGGPVPKPEAGLPAGTPFEQLMIAAVDPKSQNKNVYVRITEEAPGDGDPRGYEQRLEDAILASGGNLTPADILETSLTICGGSYLLASLTAHNLLKNIAYQGRQQTALVGGLINRGREDIAFPPRYGDVAAKLVNLRSAAGDKMGIWYHLFVPLTISAWTDNPEEADDAIFYEYLVRSLGSLTNMGSPKDAEKKASDECFAQSAHEIHTFRNRDPFAGGTQEAPPEKTPEAQSAPPPPPPPPPAANTACPASALTRKKCPWTPDGYAVGECGPGFCWNGGPRGTLSCKQEETPASAHRNDLDDVWCNDGLTARRDPCTGVVTSCE